MLDINAIVVIYYPSDSVIFNVFSYSQYVNKVYIYDNSPTNEFEKILEESEIQNYEYYHFPCNLGLAKPINDAAKKSYKDNIRYLLTMDQDSSFKDFMVLSDYVHNDIDDMNSTAIYSPFHDTGTRITSGRSISYVKSVMTSGNIINLSVFEKLGGCDERFFIDCIDHDLCSRVIFSGKKIKQINNCVLSHNLGENIRIKCGVEVTNHSPIRRYYITRNTFYLVEKNLIKHPLYSSAYMLRFIKNTLICIFYENNKWEKIRYILKGIKGYISRDIGMYYIK